MISVAIGMLIAAGVLILVGVLLLYIWKVPSLISELSGKTSRQNVKKLQKINSSEEMSSTDFYRAMTSGALSEYDLEDPIDHKSNSDLSDILSSIDIKEGRRLGKRRKVQENTSAQLESSSNLLVDEAPAHTSGSLSSGLLGRRQEDNAGALDFTEDVSTGYFVDEDEVVQSDTPIGAFSSTRVVSVTREYSSLT